MAETINNELAIKIDKAAKKAGIDLPRSCECGYAPVGKSGKFGRHVWARYNINELLAILPGNSACGKELVDPGEPISYWACLPVDVKGPGEFKMIEYHDNLGVSNCLGELLLWLLKHKPNMVKYPNTPIKTKCRECGHFDRPRIWVPHSEWLCGCSCHH